MGVDENRDDKRSRRWLRLPAKAVLLVAAALGAGAAVAIGAIPGSNGTITACYNTNDGATNPYGTPVPYGELRVIDPSLSTSTVEVEPDEYSCESYEQTITWNQQGPQGIQGVQGIQGIQGPKGSQGPAGAPGTAASPAEVIGQTTFSIDAGPSSRLFLKIAGISGPTTVKGATGDVELSSFGAGTEGAVTGSATSGAGAGKATAQLFEFVKAVNATSSPLFKDLASGKVIPTMTVIVDHASGDTLTTVATYTLTDVKITGIKDTGDPGIKGEQVTGEFVKLSGDVGTGTTKVATGWNQVTNSPTLGLPPTAGLP
jgi:type VI protein secretion system component Hcp